VLCPAYAEDEGLVSTVNGEARFEVLLGSWGLSEVVEHGRVTKNLGEAVGLFGGAIDGPGGGLLGGVSGGEDIGAGDYRKELVFWREIGVGGDLIIGVGGGGRLGWEEKVDNRTEDDGEEGGEEGHKQVWGGRGRQNQATCGEELAGGLRSFHLCSLVICAKAERSVGCF